LIILILGFKKNEQLVKEGKEELLAHKKVKMIKLDAVYNSSASSLKHITQEEIEKFPHKTVGLIIGKMPKDLVCELAQFLRLEDIDRVISVGEMLLDRPAEANVIEQMQPTIDVVGDAIVTDDAL
jgi:hypothetical protein